MLCVVSAGMLFAQAKPAGDDVVVQADKALAAAYAKGDMAAAAKFFDSDFSWITTDGIHDGTAGRAASGTETAGHRSRHRGSLEFKYGDKKSSGSRTSQGQKFAAHFWVKRPEGWRLCRST